MRAIALPNAVEALINALADAVAARLAERAANDVGAAYYSSEDAPCGPRAFLRGARDGGFPSFKRGRRVLARRAAVEAWIEAQPRAVRPSPPPQDDDAALLAAAGIRLKGKL